MASRALVLQQKSRGPVQSDITEPARAAVLAWITYSRLKSEDFRCLLEEVAWDANGVTGLDCVSYPILR